jgi:hypothetical protein
MPARNRDLPERSLGSITAGSVVGWAVLANYPDNDNGVGWLRPKAVRGNEFM